MRFAILCRVSSEDQLSGQSLDVQRKTLRQCVKSLGGEIVKEYIGQESATKSDRPILDSLLADCSSGLFDCVMVYDSSRLDRDPVRAKISFATFKKYGIKLYIQHSLYDLNNPESAFIASLMSEVSQFQVAIQTRKSIESKIELAKRGYPVTNGPHGRRLVSQDKSKPAVYEIIPEYKQQAEEIYDLYVNQKIGTDRISRMMGMRKSQLRAILFEYSGEDWIQKIKYNGQTLTIITKVPPLLTDEQIAQAKHIAQSNKKFNSRIHDYLLGGRLKFGICRTHFIGMSSKKKKYYYHSKEFRTPICLKSIRVGVIETAVLESLSELFSSTTNLKKAIEDAIDVSKDKKEFLTRKIEEARAELNKLEREKDKLVDLSLKGIFTDEEISKKMYAIRNDTLEVKDNLKKYSIQLETLTINIPDDLHLRIQKYYRKLCNDDWFGIEDCSFESQQRLIDWFFGIGKENGVFVSRNNEGCIDYIVKGALASSFFGIINPFDGDRYFVATNKQTREFEDNEQLVDFKRIIRDLEVLDENGVTRISGG